MKLVLHMHNHGGDTEHSVRHTPTELWVRDCEVQVKANEHQKVAIQREEGVLTIYFWTTGVTENSAPDHKIQIPPLGMKLELEAINESSDS